MLDPLIYARAVHFAASIMTAGVALFAVFIAEPTLRDAGDGARWAGAVRSRLAGIAWISLALALLSGAGWLVLAAASMSGEPPADVFSGGVLWTVLSQTGFGNAWLLRFVVACALAVVLVRLLPVGRAKSAWLKTAAALLAAIFVGSLAWSGHGAGGLGNEAVAHPAADVLHLVAAAAWVGALVPLVLLLKAAGEDRHSLAVARQATLRFSTLGLLSVATLVVTGLVNSWYLVGSIAALLDTDYGRLLTAKIAFFLGMVGIAAVNRLHLTPAIMRDADAAGVHKALRQLRRNAAVEATLGALVIVIVALLGTLPPAAHAGHHHPEYSSAVAADAAFQHIHSERGMADVTIEPGRVGAARVTIRLWTEDFEPLEARRVTFTLTPPGPGGKPLTRRAVQDPEGAWQVEGLELSQPGAWTIEVDAVLGAERRLVLEAPVAIEPRK